MFPVSNVSRFHSRSVMQHNHNTEENEELVSKYQIYLLMENSASSKIYIYLLIREISFRQKHGREVSSVLDT